MTDPFDYAVDYYQRALGLTPEQARGAVRWMSRVESGLNPSAFNPAGGGQGAFGIGQWRGPRLRSLREQYGSNPNLDQQLAFSVSELKGPESRALQALKAAGTEHEAFAAWGRDYERPGGDFGSGLRKFSGAPEGYYDNALHLTLRPHEPATLPPTAVAALDALLGQQPDNQGRDPLSLSLLDNLLQPRQTEERRTVPPEGDTIEPPGPVPSAPNMLADTPPLSAIEMRPIETAATTTAATPATAQRQAAQPDTIEPVALGQTMPMQSPIRDVGTGIPLDLSATSNQPPEGLLDHLLNLKGAPTDVAQTIAGLAERAGLGAYNIGRLAAGGHPADIARAQTPIEPGMRELEGLLEFASGGLTSPLASPTREAAQMAGGVSREAAGAIPGALSDVRGGRPPARIEPPPLRGLPAPQQTLPTVTGGGASGPPAIPPTGGAVGRPLPRPEPGPMPSDMVHAETAPPREPRATTGGESAVMKMERLLAMRETQDKLFKVWTRSEEFKLRTLRAFAEEPRLSGEEKLQLERYMEWQPGMPQVPAPSGEAMDIYQRVIRPAQLSAARDYAWLKARGATEHVMPEALEDLTEGYIHRIRSNVGPPERSAFDPFGGVRALRQRTSSMHGRARWYVLQDKETGRRVFSQDTLDKHDYSYGQKIDIKGREWEVRPPTTEEIEANTDVRYLHDPALASIQNMTQLHLARMNVEALHNEILPDLKARGLAETSREAAMRNGLTESELPALRGHFFEPRLTHAFDDFYRTPTVLHGDIAHALSLYEQINRFAISFMFANPIGHMRNVLSDYALARGGLWFAPGFGRLPQSMREAWVDVTTGSRFYRDVMKAGGSLMGAGQENRVAYQMLLRKAQQELTTLPNIDAIAEQTGIWKSGKEMAEKLWNGSQKVMWGFHDMLLLARVRELMATKKLGVETAVREAERFIADYRVPATIGEDGKIVKLPKPIARTASVAMQDRSMFVFGRYHYNKLHALANTIRDAGNAMTRSGMSAGERAEALGRFGAMLFFSTILQYSVNKTLQAVTGNPEARAHVPGALGIPANLARVGSDIMTGQGQEAVYDFSMAMASIVTPMPALIEVAEQLFNKDLYGRQDIAGNQLDVGQQMLQRGVHAAGQLLSPVREMVDIAKGKGVPSLGISLPDPAAVERAKRPHGRERRYQQRGFQRQFGPAREAIGWP